MSVSPSSAAWASAARSEKYVCATAACSDRRAAARSSALAWALAWAALTPAETRPHRSSSQLAVRPSEWLVLMRAVVLPSPWLDSCVPLRARLLLALAPTVGKAAAPLLVTAAWAARRRAALCARVGLLASACCCRRSSTASPYTVHQVSGKAVEACGCAGFQMPWAWAAACSL